MGTDTIMPDATFTLLDAELSAPDEITVRVAESCSVNSVQPDGLIVINEGGLEVRVAEVRPKFARDGRAKTFGLRIATELRFTHHCYRVRTVQGGRPAQSIDEVPVQVGRLLADPAHFYDGDAVMGAVCTPQSTTFRLFAPAARSVRLTIGDSPDAGTPGVIHDLERAERGLWQLHLEGDLRGKFYSYRVSTPGAGTSGEVSDPATLCACGLRARTMLVHLEDTNPPGFDPSWAPKLDSYVDAIIYEMHVRDFTVSANSGVERRGRFLGLTESGTHLPNDPAIKTGLDHLVELGVTHVQLMPVQDFDNEETFDGAYDWGYMPVHFNSPDGWYATSQIGDARIREFKQAVQAFHDRGIAVCMDVVYNHTSGRAPFEKIAPGYYHRMTRDGHFSNGSGCGNEFNSEQPMAKKYMLESLSYWVTQYGIDGFRFDLMGLHDPRTMYEVREALARIKPGIMIYGEPWTAGGTTLRRTTDKGQVRGKGIGCFNDGFRDAVKGDRDGGPAGFVQTGDRIDGVKDGVTGAIGSWAMHPSDAIQYSEAHDNLTTWDKLTQSVGGIPEDIRKRMQCFAGLIVLTSQGVPFLHAGQEFCRSKKGNNNSYNAPDDINQIDWSQKETHPEVFAYYQGLISLRKSHPVFRLRTGDEVRRRVAFREDAPHHKCVAYTIDGAGLADESWLQAVVLFNGDAHDQTFHLPDGKWGVHADHQRATPEPFERVSGSVTLRSHSGAILARMAEEPKAADSDC